MKKREQPQILALETIAKTRFFHVESVKLEYSNGMIVDHERIKSPDTGAVLIIPMLDNETVLLIREYATGVDRYELALPKGRIERNEEIHHAANRELMEEVGYGARQLTTLKTLTSAPSYQSSQIHIILAQDLFEQQLEGDEPEPIEVVPYPLHDLSQLIERSDVTEARSIAALFMARDLLIN